MNLKKTIAALSAAAVAVSAMATSVSAAFADHTVSFNLVQHVPEHQRGTATFRAVIQSDNNTINNNGDLVIQFVNGSDISFTHLGDGEVKITTEVMNTRSGARENPKRFTTYAGNDEVPTWQYTDGIRINPMYAVSGDPLVYGSDLTDFYADRAGDPVDLSDTASRFIGTRGFQNDDRAFLPSDTDKRQDLEGMDAIEEIVFKVSDRSMVGNEQRVTVTLELGHYESQREVSRAFNGGDGAVALNLYQDTSSDVINVAEVRRNALGAAGIGNGGWLAYNGDEYSAIVEAGGTQLTEEQTADRPAMTNVTSDSWDSIRYPMATNTHGRISFVDDDYDAYKIATPGVAANYGLTTQNDILYYLGLPGLNGTVERGGEMSGIPYYNAQAIINDAIANYNSVTVVFHTAKENVGHDFNDRTGNGWGAGRYIDWESSETDLSTPYYKSLQPQLYNRFHGDAADGWGMASPQTGYVDYSFGSLFSGALLINGQHTMSLSDINAFDYSETTLSFNLDKIFANPNSGAAYNPALGYIWSMRLATSNLWFWDSMDIVAANVETETVETIAPLVEDEDILDEEEFGEEDLDWEVEEPDFDWEPEEIEPEVEVIPTTPPTGNASAALAVIPVALAAAAIVIKKRK